MSGGVDSAVAAALLVEQGVPVIGATLRLFCSSETGSRATACCSAESIRRAAAACDILGVPHVVLDEKAAFRRAVMDPFTDAYLQGETPIPCAACNSDLKFGSLFERASLYGADTVATGHYARLAGDNENDWRIERAVDRRKDQTYFLWGIDRRRLVHIRFPLGDRTKEDVRAKAREWKLPMADVVESQDVCFVEGRDYAEVVLDTLEERAKNAGLPPGALAPRPGPILDTGGRTLGTHRGLVHYTVGQRKGLGVTAPFPLYVVALDPRANTVTVGREEDLLARTCHVRNVNWLTGAPRASRRLAVQIRYRHTAAPADVAVDVQGHARVTFDEPQRAVTPGQSAVFYDGDVLVGGGIIARQASSASQSADALQTSPARSDKIS
jgi:tRNA-specific 2-thiouridylase